MTSYFLQTICITENLCKAQNQSKQSCHSHNDFISIDITYLTILATIWDQSKIMSPAETYIDIVFV
jgi:hypothetical protein